MTVLVVGAVVAGYLYYRIEEQARLQQARSAWMWSVLFLAIAMVVAYHLLYDRLNQKWWWRTFWRRFEELVTGEGDSGPVTLRVGATDQATGERKEVTVGCPQVGGAKEAFDALFSFVDKVLHVFGVTMGAIYAARFVGRLFGTTFPSSSGDDWYQYGDGPVACSCGGADTYYDDAASPPPPPEYHQSWWSSAMDKLWFAVIGLHLRMFVVALVDAARRLRIGGPQQQDQQFGVDVHTLGPFIAKNIGALGRH